jgi:small subunit ribosomal protein S5
MEKETNTIENIPIEPTATETKTQKTFGVGAQDRRSSFQKNPRKSPRREARAKPEFDQKIISIRRVTRVVTGGRRFSFSVAMVAGNKKGSVGVGIGKAGDTSLAIDKALRAAKKNMINVVLTKDMSISHDVEAKYCGSRVMIMPAPGKGVIAGSSVRSVLELAGIKNSGAKIFSRSKNKLNNARAAIEALKKLKVRKSKLPEEVKA